MKLLLSYVQKNITKPKFPNYHRIHAISRLLHLDSYYKTDPSDLIYSYNRAIQGHIKFGCLANALQLFDEMPQRDVVSWNLLITGYKRHGMPCQAFDMYAQMVNRGFRESPSTFSSVLSICSNYGLYFEGLQVHCRVVSLGFCGNLYIGSASLDLYLQIGFVDVGLKVLDQLPERNFAIWNVVLRRFCELGMWDEVLGLYPRIVCDGVELNELMVCYLIQGCANGSFDKQGEQLHCHTLKAGLVESNLFVANGLVDFYSACGSLSDVHKSFEGIQDEDVISWTSIVSAHAYNGRLFDAIEYFTMMQFWSKKPTVRSLVALLNSCGENKNLFLGREIHCLVLKLGFDRGSIHLRCAMINMYGYCNEINSSVDVYEGYPEMNKDCCNALLTSMLQCNFFEETVELFKVMVDEGIAYDEVSLSTTLKAISGSSFASLSSCRLLHSSVIRSGLEYSMVVSGSLIDSYAKMGQIKHSRQVFESIPSPNVVCFTSIINGYAWNGLGRECLKLLETMTQRGLKPDRVTFLCVLTGCNHSGLVEEGKLVFDSMRTLHGIDPDRRHYSCMVDLLGRAGLVCEAEQLLEQSLENGDSVMWSSLLRSCRLHKNEAVGQRVVKRLMELEPVDPAACLQASSFYSELGDSALSMHYREIAMARKVIREIGHSFVDVSFHGLTA